MTSSSVQAKPRLRDLAWQRTQLPQDTCLFVSSYHHTQLPVCFLECLEFLACEPLSCDIILFPFGSCGKVTDISESTHWDYYFKNNNKKNINDVYWISYFLATAYINQAHICDYTLNIGDEKLNRAYLAEENASIHAHNLINTILELWQWVLGEQVIIIIAVVYRYLLSARHCAKDLILVIILRHSQYWETHGSIFSS